MNKHISHDKNGNLIEELFIKRDFCFLTVSDFGEYLYFYNTIFLVLIMRPIALRKSFLKIRQPRALLLKFYYYTMFFFTTEGVGYTDKTHI